MKKKQLWKTGLAMFMAFAVMLTSVPVPAVAAIQSQTAGAEAVSENTVASRALAYYDFADFSFDGRYSFVSEDGRTLPIKTAGEGVAPVMVDDGGRGNVLELTQQSYANRGYVTLPSPFEADASYSGVTFNFWMKTTGGAAGSNTLLNVEAAPDTDNDGTTTEDPNRAGTFAINQGMIYRNMTAQGGPYTDFNTANVGYSAADGWKMVTVTVTNEAMAVYSNGQAVEYTVAGGTEDYATTLKELTGTTGNSAYHTAETVQIQLGASGACYWNCAGARMDDVSIYGEALSAEDVAALYEETQVVVNVESVVVTGKTEVEEGRTIKLSAAIGPEDANVDKTVTWASSDEDVLTVAADGTVTGVAVGSASVTATVAGVTSAPFAVNVTAPSGKGVSENAIVYYDFGDFEAAEGAITDGERSLSLVTTGSGKAPELVEDSMRGTVLSLTEQSYDNSGYALLDNPFAGLSTKNGFTLNFWTKTTGSNGGGKCLVDFEVAPASSGRAGTFAVNQGMIYWNTTDQNAKFTDFNIGNVGFAPANGWRMVTVSVTEDGITVYSNGDKIKHTITAGTADYAGMIGDLAGTSGLTEAENTNVRLGASLATYWSCAGALMDDVSFYGEALTDADVKSLFQETFIPVPLKSVTVTGKNLVEEQKTLQLGVSLTPADTTVDKTVTWESSDESVLTIDENGLATAVAPGNVTVTATVAGIKSAEFAIEVTSCVESLEEGYYLAVYTTTTPFYAQAGNLAQETESVYFAVSKDGKTFDVLNNGGGVIFSSNTSGSLRIAEPRVFKDADGFTVVAEDYNVAKGYHVFTSEDGVNYYDDTLVASTELAAAALKKSSFDFVLDGEDILDSDEGITLGNALEITEEEYTYIVNKLGTVVNTGMKDMSVEISKYEGIDTEAELTAKAPKATATYSDGSTQEFNVDWSGALDGVDLTKEGTYTVSGQVIQTKYLNNLKELNGSTLPEDDPANDSETEADNYDEETGEVFYDETKYVEGMADPCIFWDEQTGYYYMTGSYFPEDGDEIDANDDLQQYDRVVLRKSKTLEGLQDRSKQVTIWKAGNQGFEDDGRTVESGYRYIWAPEIHRVGDKWVVYFTESHSPSDLFNIYCHALVLDGSVDPYTTALTASDEASKWQDYKMIASDDIMGSDPFDTAFCLDMTYFEDEKTGADYVIWAGKPTAAYQGGNTDLFIATVDEETPWMITSAASRLTKADYGWERVRYCVNEGATVLQKDGNVFMCYSASGTGSEYAIGMLSAKAGENLLEAGNWIKSPYPLLTSRDVDGEEGPGHNSFTVDQDGNVIFVYHARPTSHNYKHCGWDGASSTYNAEPLNDPCRHARLKRVHWAADGTPILKMTYEEELKDEFKTVNLTITVTNKPIEQEKPSVPSTPTTPSKPQTPAKPAVAQVKVEKTKLTLGVKESYTIAPTALPSGSETTFTYKTSNKKVATVDAKGKIKAKKTGKANITVTSANGKSVTIKVTVKKAPNKITVTTKSKTLKKGKTFKIKYKLPKNTASNKITFKSSNKKVATVDAKGKVKALKKGKATITVQTFNKKKAKIKITVK